jgi:hypothetical protein
LTTNALGGSEERGGVIARYPARCRDAHGDVTTAIENGGKMLRMVVCGVEFTGERFEDFGPSAAQDDPALAPFSSHGGSLRSCMIACAIPLPGAVADEVVDGLLHVQIRTW